MINLKTRTIHGLFWSFFERMGAQAIHFIVTLILARLLFPSQFGLIAMLSIFMAIAQSLMDSGFGSALIQKKDATHTDFCSIFYFNIITSFFIATLLYFSAPLIASFFDQAILIPLTRFLSLNVVISSFGLIQNVTLIKKIDFMAKLKVSLLAMILSGTVGITLAYQGFGVWSLAVQSVLITITRTVSLWFVNPWRPSLTFSFDSLKSMFPFGSRLLFSGLLETFFQNIYKVFIGKVFSPIDLGFYDRANSMKNFITTSTGPTLSRVMFPSLSTIQDDPARLKRAYRKSIRLSVFIHFPLMICLAALAPTLIIILLTERWENSIPYFQLLCISGLLYPLQDYNLNLLKVKGRSDLFFRLELIHKFFIIVSIAITYKWGVSGLIFGQIIVSIIAYLLNSFFSGKLIGYPTLDQVKDIAPIFTIAIITGLFAFITGELILSNDLIRLFSQIMVSVCVFLGLSYLVKISALFELSNLVKNFLEIKTATLSN